MTAKVAVIAKVGGNWTVEIDGVVIGTRRTEMAAHHLATANGATMISVRESVTKVTTPPLPVLALGIEWTG